MKIEEFLVLSCSVVLVEMRRFYGFNGDFRDVLRTLSNFEYEVYCESS